VRDKLAQQLATYDYEVLPVDVSAVVLEHGYQTMAESAEPLPTDAYERVRELQRRGDDIREQHGSDIIARVVVEDVIKNALPKEKRSQRIAVVVDSLKHPQEIDFFRKVFGRAFYSVGVVCPDEIRRERLKKRKNLSDEQFRTVSKYDAETDAKHGQKAIQTVVLSDYFVRNDFSTKAELERSASRLLSLIFHVGMETPTKDEMGMNAAFKAAAGSACLSRQVGAAVFSSEGQVLATGCNDVPKFGGGSYTAESTPDRRCYAMGAKCFNDYEKSLIVDELVTALQEAAEKESIQLPESTKDVVARSRIRRLIEFSRAVHAEMDALMSVARNGVRGVAGGTLYCTTYPCHACAKHIVSVGLSRVVYLEPYEKSLALKLHGDAIAQPTGMSGQEEGGHVSFEQFGGVAPRRFDDLFEMRSRKRKDKSGQYIDNDRRRREAEPEGAQYIALLSANLAENFVQHTPANAEAEGEDEGRKDEPRAAEDDHPGTTRSSQDVPSRSEAS
jgi:deoxycytidylate deaminase